MTTDSDPRRDWPEGLPRSVESALLKGGMICTTTWERLTDGREVVVKRCPYPAEVEAEGLLALAAAGAPTPAVLGAVGHTLVLEYVDGQPDWAMLGRAMARVHGAATIGEQRMHEPPSARLSNPAPSSRSSADPQPVSSGSDGWTNQQPALQKGPIREPRSQASPAAASRSQASPSQAPPSRELLTGRTVDRYGWHRDNPAGLFDQSNKWTDDWPTFFVQQRILAHLADPSVPAAIARRLRNASTGALVDLLPARPQVSLTHGDLWFGNVVAGCWIVDPAVCYADRELDLAFMQTGGLPDEFFDAYQREWPFEPGYERRRPALQLHKHLVGLRHFGPARYLPRIEAVLDHYRW